MIIVCTPSPSLILSFDRKATISLLNNRGLHPFLEPKAEAGEGVRQRRHRGSVLVPFSVSLFTRSTRSRSCCRYGSSLQFRLHRQRKSRRKQIDNNVVTVVVSGRACPFKRAMIVDLILQRSKANERNNLNEAPKQPRPKGGQEDVEPPHQCRASSLRVESSRSFQDRRRSTVLNEDGVVGWMCLAFRSH